MGVEVKEHCDQAIRIHLPHHSLHGHRSGEFPIGGRKLKSNGLRVIISPAHWSPRSSSSVTLQATGARGDRRRSSIRATPREGVALPTLSPLFRAKARRAVSSRSRRYTGHHRLDRRVVALDLLEQLEAIQGRCLIEGRRLNVNEHEIGKKLERASWAASPLSAAATSYWGWSITDLGGWSSWHSMDQLTSDYGRLPA